jgi:hypothetical protein
MSPIKPASPTKHKLDETFEGSPARVERTVDPVPERHAPATPLLNAFTANIARSSSNDSGSTSSPIKSLSFQTATELSPIVSGALPSDDDTVNLYIKMTSKGKDVKPVCFCFLFMHVQCSTACDVPSGVPAQGPQCSCYHGQ